MMIKIEKSSLIIVLSFLLIFQTAKSFTVASPQPVDLKLLRGDTAKIFFDIQAVTSADKLSCSYSVQDLDPLVVTFDTNEVVVDARSEKFVYGTISVPDDAPMKIYEGWLTVSCKSYNEVQDVSGGSVSQNGHIRFPPIEVVSQKEERVVRELPTIAEKEIIKPKASPIILILIIIVLILAIIGFIFSRKKKTE